MVSKSEAGQSAGADDDLAARLRIAAHRLSRRLRTTRAGEGLTPTQLSILATVGRYGPMRLSDLAESEAVNPTMLSRVSQKLEQASLIVRRPDTQDGRAFLLELTDKGRRLQAKIRAERTDTLSRKLAELDPASRKKLAGAIEVLEGLAEDLKDRPEK